MPLLPITRALVTFPLRGTSARRASTASSTSDRFPYPTGPHPTPHQIFHLAPGATQKDIKARYYDLVRIHHPDSPSCRHLSPAQRHSRFQSISAAYDTLRGRRPTPSSPRHAGMEHEIERRRAYREYRRRSSPPPAFDPDSGGRQWTASADDRVKDRMLMIVAGVAFVIAFSPLIFANPYYVGQERHRVAAANLAEARQEAQEVGHERRRAIRRRVEEHRQSLLESQRDGNDQDSS